MSQERIDIQYEEHLNELIERTKACTKEEQMAMAKVIAREDPDILFIALSSEMDRLGKKIAKFEMALEREEA